MSDNDFDLVFADIVLKGAKGVDILDYVSRSFENLPVVMITGRPEIDTASEALRLKAFDYLVKPVTKDTVIKVANFALKTKYLYDLNQKIEEEKENYRRNLDVIFKSVKDGIIYLDNNFYIAEFNSAAERICGFNPVNTKGLAFDKPAEKCSGECVYHIKNAAESYEETDSVEISCMRKEIPDQKVLLSCSFSERDKSIVIVLRDITEFSRIKSELKKTRFPEIIKGSSPEIHKVFNLISGLSSTDTSVLITGESGTGKELVAKSLHYSGIRSDKPFVTVNCSALSENLLETELFGHVKGAFTGAVRDKKGKFAIADKGTLFLDEIGDISPAVQVRLLRFLQEKEFEPVGDNNTVKVDVRIVAATNRNLKALVKSGQFREDLYYRLNVLNIEMPPLRKRVSDIPVLSDHFRKVFNKKFCRNIKEFTEDVYDIFYRYLWPGNVRELEHVIEHAFIMSTGKKITPEHLPLELENRLFSSETEDLAEKEKIVKILEQTDYNKAKAARLLNMSRQTMYRKIKDYNL
jgi:DNA-binding NtrC family response regulator